MLNELYYSIMGYYDRDYKKENSEDLVSKVKDYFGLDQGLKHFIQDNIWALGFGVLNGVLDGKYSSNSQEVFNAVLLWGGLIPAFQSIQMPYKEALKRSPKNIALYLAAYNLAQVVFYWRM